MENKRYAVRLVLLAAVLMLLFHGSGVLAAGYDMPTLFHNDEAWYKDSMAPLPRDCLALVS